MNFQALYCLSIVIYMYKILMSFEELIVKTKTNSKLYTKMSVETYLLSYKKLKFIQLNKVK